MKANSSDTNHARRAVAPITLHDTMTVMPTALDVNTTKLARVDKPDWYVMTVIVLLAVLALWLT